MITFALTWLSVALGLVSKSVEAASNLPMPLMLLPFLGSGFVPTDSMPTGCAGSPSTSPSRPFIETLRGLLLGTAIGNSAISPSPGASSSRWSDTSGPGRCSTATRARGNLTEAFSEAGTSS